MTTSPEAIDRMSNKQIVDYIQGEAPLNLARQQFQYHLIKINHACNKRAGLEPIKLLRMQLKAVLAIATALHDTSRR